MVTVFGVSNLRKGRRYDEVDAREREVAGSFMRFHGSGNWNDSPGFRKLEDPPG